MEMLLKVALAALFLMMIWRMWPVAKAQMENGPRAQAGDWKAVMVPLALVVGFVALLIWMVRQH